MAKKADAPATDGQEPEGQPEGPAPETREPKGLGRASLDDIRMDTLRGDVKDLILQKMRDVKQTLPWTVLPERDQRQAIEEADAWAGRIIERVGEAMSARGFSSLSVKVDKWQIDAKGLKLQCSTMASPANLELMAAEAGDGAVIGNLVFADPGDFQGEREAIAPLKDQPDLGDNDPEGPVFDNTPSGGKP